MYNKVPVVADSVFVSMLVKTDDEMVAVVAVVVVEVVAMVTVIVVTL